jgi:hypothetical protein
VQCGKQINDLFFSIPSQIKLVCDKVDHFDTQRATLRFLRYHAGQIITVKLPKSARVSLMMVLN